MGSITKKSPTIVFCIVILFISCISPIKEEPDLEFAKMEIHYTKLGGWINTSKLDIYGSGLVNAYHISHASTEVLDSAKTFLSDEDQKRISSLFRSFSSYDRHYEPDQYVTDQNYHTTILDYEGVSDTVSVYMPHKANIPEGLKQIIEEMDSLWESMFE